MDMKKQQLIIDGLAAEIVFKPIKNLYLRVLEPDGRVALSAPLGTPEARLFAFVREKRAWIERRREALAAGLPELEDGGAAPLWGEWLPLRLRLSDGRGGVTREGDGLLLRAPAGADAAARREILEAFYRRELMRAVPALLDACERAAGLRAEEWRIRRMKTRWGSCNVQARRIWLNLRLAEKPVECLRYVILHELCHLYERGHGKAFWARMDACCPEWRRLRRRLNAPERPCT
ncbi:MAG: SprT family zinc-dependent metalloprotease [Clostridia bacterium]|nr:SprT family zinc-dependent metalloprotease [Clostridia bacterium]